MFVYVDVKFLGKGTGSALYAEIEKAAKISGIKNIISIIVSKNAASISFHKKHGFKEVGYLQDVGFKFNRSLSVKYFQKSL